MLLNGDLGEDSVARCGNRGEGAMGKTARVGRSRNYCRASFLTPWLSTQHEVEELEILQPLNIDCRGTQCEDC